MKQARWEVAKELSVILLMGGVCVLFLLQGAHRTPFVFLPVLFGSAAVTRSIRVLVLLARRLS